MMKHNLKLIIIDAPATWEGGENCIVWLEITFATENLAPTIQESTAIEEESHSNHNYISYKLNMEKKIYITGN